MLALQSLKENLDIVLFPADKENLAIVFDSNYCNFEITTLLKYESYIPLVRNLVLNLNAK